MEFLNPILSNPVPMYLLTTIHNVTSNFFITTKLTTIILQQLSNHWLFFYSPCQNVYFSVICVVISSFYVVKEEIVYLNKS